MIVSLEDESESTIYHNSKPSDMLYNRAEGLLLYDQQIYITWS